MFRGLWRLPWASRISESATTFADVSCKTGEMENKKPKATSAS